jgi:hypothetical protein
MEFHLIYVGNLLKAAGRANARVWEKHAIRRYLHPQIRKLWETHPTLRYYGGKIVERDDEGNEVIPPRQFLDHLAANYSRAGIGFIPQ